MEDEDVTMVDGVFEGAFGALGDKTWSENDILAFDGTVQLDTFQLKKSTNIGRSRKIGIIWSFSLLEKFKRGKIPFICKDGMTIVGNFKNLAKLCERKSNEVVLNHERDEDVTGFFSLKSDLTVKKFAIVEEMLGVSDILRMYDLVRGISPTIARGMLIT
uniref:Uncharacterized protein n=1 Tax=Tanacetum cinerariifolium TaxID=118510 RepID=A0A699IAZ5_TANCI|nr:hypothetical protein [Tanacetum cinerariifolium]